jgi:signal peptidase II
VRAVRPGGALDPGGAGARRLSREVGLRSLFALISAAVLLLDQVTKRLVTSAMPMHSSVEVIPDLFHLTLVTNRGALFGLLHDLPDPYRSSLFTLVPLLAIGLIVYFQLRTTLQDTLAHTGLALILGGALGNLVDRVRLGHVIDFLDVFIGDHHWPAFNAADSSICIGVSLLILDLMLSGRRRREPESTTTGSWDAPGSV